MKAGSLGSWSAVLGRVGGGELGFGERPGMWSWSWGRAE